MPVSLELRLWWSISVLILGNSLHTNSRGVLEFRAQVGRCAKRGKGNEALFSMLSASGCGKVSALTAFWNLGWELKHRLPLIPKCLVHFIVIQHLAFSLGHMAVATLWDTRGELTLGLVNYHLCWETSSYILPPDLEISASSLTVHIVYTVYLLVTSFFAPPLDCQLRGILTYLCLSLHLA